MFALNMNKGKGSHSVMSNSLLPHGLQPTRLLCLWDYPGKSTGVGVPSPSPKYEQSYPKLIPCAFGGNEGLGYKSCSELLTKPDNRIILHPIIFSALGPVQFCLETWLQMNLWDHFVLTG